MSDRGLIILCALVLVIMAVMGGALAASGLAIGLLTAVAFLVLALKSSWVRAFARGFPLTADLMATGVAYLLFPPGVTAFIGSGVVALSVTILIAVDRIMNPGPEPSDLPEPSARVIPPFKRGGAS